eukprot:Skav233357  [mRNA]  locus=scaffold394:549866:556044:+ [translate_table: standard]
MCICILYVQAALPYLAREPCVFAGWVQQVAAAYQTCLPQDLYSSGSDSVDGWTSEAPGSEYQLVESHAWNLLETYSRQNLSRQLTLALIFRAWRIQLKQLASLSCHRCFLAWAVLPRLKKGLEATVDPSPTRMELERGNQSHQRPILLHDVLVGVWFRWRGLVGDGGKGCLARWRRLLLALLGKERRQLALESMVDALDARASQTQDAHTESASGEIQKLLTQVAFISWKSWWQAESYRNEVGQVKQALSSTESCAKVMLRDVVSDLQSNYDLLGLVLIFRSWYSLLVSQKLWNCQRGFIGWTRLRKDCAIPEFTSDLESITLLSAAWRHWHIFTRNGPLESWRRVVRSALQRLSRQVALESLVDALDARAEHLQLERGHQSNQRPILLHDVLVEIWSTWRDLVGDGGKGCLARWRRLLLALLGKERRQLALESLVDALDARASHRQNRAISVSAASSPLPEVLLLVFRCWRLAVGNDQTQSRFRGALSELKVSDTNWLHARAVLVQAAFLGWKSLRGESKRHWQLLQSSFGSWRSRCVGCRQLGSQSSADLSPIHPSEPSDSQHEESLTSTACREGPALNSTFLSPKQPEEEELPTALENAGQPEEEQAPAPPTVFQPFITPTSAHTRTDSEEHKLDTFDLFDQLDLERPEPISAREEEIQKRIYLKRHFFLEGELGHVLQLSASNVAFAAFRADREVVTWTRGGGNREVLSDGRGVTYVSPVRQ